MPLASSGVTARFLAERSHGIISGLHSVNIDVVSYSCDGTEIERSVERILVAEANVKKTYAFKHPALNQSPIEITIPVFDGNAIAFGQDTKHLRKTLRNNLFSGARVLTLGGHIITMTKSEILRSAPRRVQGSHLLCSKGMLSDWIVKMTEQLLGCFRPPRFVTFKSQSLRLHTQRYKCLCLFLVNSAMQL